MELIGKWILIVLLEIAGLGGAVQTISGQAAAESAPQAVSAEDSAEGEMGIISGMERHILAMLDGLVYIPSAYADLEVQNMASVGEVAFPVFVVEFQDVKYTDSKVDPEEVRRWVFGEDDESVAGFYYISSYGRLQMEGDVYYYTAQGNIADYESNAGVEALVMEMLDYYDEEVDFSQYDINGDELLDTLILSVPIGGDSSFWWAAQHTWYENWGYSVDGVFPLKYIVSDEQPYQKTRTYYVSTLRHELGHCMGLPDYYKYNYTGVDFEGLHGLAGKEMMDDSQGDFSQFSKLQLGWLTREQVQIMPDDAQRMTFSLPPAVQGGCVLIFPPGQEPNFQGEYFLVEYITPEGYHKGTFSQGGVRVLHVQAEMMTQDGYYYSYKYNNFSPYYDSSNNGIRVLKLVNDGNGFYHEGDVVTFENTGGAAGNFGWYTEEGTITDPGFEIRIGEMQEDGAIEIEVIRKTGW
ncbi:MAG: hypothetical protein HDR26_01145 [Lachnospiraceae bacterium]|nr:hypothetical protein [Lachnospiraceae bacterium]